MERKKINLVLSKKGIPCLWESGGKTLSSGYAVIITDADGFKKQPIFIKKNSREYNLDHALIPIRVGDYIIYTYYYENQYTHKVYLVKSIEKDMCEIECRFEYVNGKWNILPLHLKNALEAAEKKASEYNCQKPFYVLPIQVNKLEEENQFSIKKDEGLKTIKEKLFDSISRLSKNHHDDLIDQNEFDLKFS